MSFYRRNFKSHKINLLLSMNLFLLFQNSFLTWQDIHNNIKLTILTPFGYTIRCIKYIYIVVQLSPHSSLELFLLSQTETLLINYQLQTISSAKPLVTTILPFFSYEFDSSRYVICMDSFNICPFVLGLFLLTFLRFMLQHVSEFHTF